MILVVMEYFGNVVCSICYGKKINIFFKIFILWLKEVLRYSYCFLKNLVYIFFWKFF